MCGRPTLNKIGRTYDIYVYNYMKIANVPSMWGLLALAPNNWGERSKAPHGRYICDFHIYIIVHTSGFV